MRTTTRTYRIIAAIFMAAGVVLSGLAVGLLIQRQAYLAAVPCFLFNAWCVFALVRDIRALLE